jgi:hypothetical protein
LNVPATTPNPAKQKRADYVPPRFVDITLTEAQRADLRLFKEAVKAEAILAWVNKRIDGLHVLSVKPTEQGFLATLTGMGTGSGHDGICLTARASSGENAIIALMYRDAVVLADKDWPTGRLDFDI